MSTAVDGVLAITATTPRRAFVEHIMGMPVSIHVRAPGRHAPEVHSAEIESAVSRAFAHMRVADRVFSTWRADSDLRRLRSGQLTVGDAHPWLMEVLDLCLQAEERTGGRFSAWHATRDGRRAFDPTGLVKGWAVDGASRHLAEVPRISWCINAGGDLLAGVGRRFAAPPPVWRVGIEDPDDPSRVTAVLPLTQGAVATSGTAARGHHILDPRTSEPVARGGSVTVLGPDLTWADIWATAAFVDPDGVRPLLGRPASEHRVVHLAITAAHRG